MRFATKTRLVGWLLATCALVVIGAVIGAAGASAAKRVPSGGQAPTSSQSRVANSQGWGNGIEAVLPADAVTPNLGAFIKSVSCPSVGDCSAVGDYYANSGTYQGLLLTETASSWSVGVEAVLPGNASASDPEVSLNAVSCASAGNCSAVGNYVDSSGNHQGLLLTETGGSWSRGVEASLPANAAASQYVYFGPGTVSCASAGNCTAVGTYLAGGPQGLLLTETAGTWASGVEAALPADALPTPSVVLGSVSCASRGNCTAVGGYQTGSGSEGLLLNETGGTWATGVEAKLPTDAASMSQNVALSSVSCSSAGDCTTVGVYDYGGDGVHARLGGNGLLLTETDGSWATGVEAALPVNAATSNAVYTLDSVSCPSAGNCSAVGVYYDSSGMQFLLLGERAGSWATGLEALPANAPTTDPSSGVGINSVSCPSAGNCGAVGTYIDSSGDAVGLLLTETAGSWQTRGVASLPANARTPSEFSPLYSVSCASAGNCSAGGFYADNSGGENGLLTGDSPPVVHLDISKNGTGSGTVSSGSIGIDCGSTCAASFPAGTSLTLTATPSPGSRFSGWSGGGCSGTGSCQMNTVVSDRTVTAALSLLPRCVVPKLQGKTLKAAEHAIRTHDCALGQIKHAASRTIKRGHVISQKPKAGKRLQHGANVSLVVSKGRR